MLVSIGNNLWLGHMYYKQLLGQKSFFGRALNLTSLKHHCNIVNCFKKFSNFTSKLGTNIARKLGNWSKTLILWYQILCHKIDRNSLFLKNVNLCINNLIWKLLKSAFLQRSFVLNFLTIDVTEHDRVWESNQKQSQQLVLACKEQLHFPLCRSA